MRRSAFFHVAVSGVIACQAFSIRAQSLSENGYVAEPGWRWGDVQAFPVIPPGAVDAQPLPAAPTGVGAGSDDPIEQALAQDNGASYSVSAPGLPLAGAEAFTGIAAIDRGPTRVPDQYTWHYVSQPAPAQRLSRSSPGLWGARQRLEHGRAVPSSLPWNRGASSWSFTTDGGTAISVGSQSIGDPQWARGATLGGVRISDQASPGTDPGDVWRYTVALGAIDTSPGRQTGDLVYGSHAGYALVGYDVSPALSLETQVEMAPELLATGFGGQLQTDWGAWSAGVARASGSLYKGWRYQAGYTVKVLDDVSLSWLGEATTAGFSDISSYEAGAVSGSASRHKWSATWGDITGSYERQHADNGGLQHSFGLTQQFWYSPNLRIGVRARRELATGDYDVGIRFSVPVF